MVGIVIQDNENIDRAIRRFKKKYERSGILKEVKKRAYFTKPSVKKRMKKIKAIRRSQRTLMEEMSAEEFASPQKLKGSVITDPFSF